MDRIGSNGSRCSNYHWARAATNYTVHMAFYSQNASTSLLINKYHRLSAPERAAMYYNLDIAGISVCVVVLHACTRRSIKHKPHYPS